ncbi:hypothetical protein [Hyphomicrobium sp. LHD-15]|uniref:hypothetical protein n=1 Tax=Hyphomicrobium sp. LHD-15 TaxID=3072142 RepID=UPI0028105F8E|nr:hypothetical protein [Hyphomicrobium sp. LHD-15]MDQ8699719.1 hypothetical protein [Hyphomicrobium sp. LHD-15]
MSLDAERLAQINANVEFALQEFRELADKDVTLDAESVAWVEGFVESARGRYLGVDGGVPEGLIGLIGSYLGEAIIAETGGQWTEDDAGGLGVAFPNGDAVYPFTKVRKQFEQGVAGGESILSFYTVAVSYIAVGGLRESAGGIS